MNFFHEDVYEDLKEKEAKDPEITLSYVLLGIYIHLNQHKGKKKKS